MWSKNITYKWIRAPLALSFRLIWNMLFLHVLFSMLYILMWNINRFKHLLRDPFCSKMGLIFRAVICINTLNSLHFLEIEIYTHCCQSCCWSTIKNNLNITNVRYTTLFKNFLLLVLNLLFLFSSSYISFNFGFKKIILLLPRAKRILISLQIKSFFL